MTPTRAEGPWTTHGDLAYPTSTTDRILREGDVIWVDAGIFHQGYASDFGRTWITSSDPADADRQRRQFQRWRAVVDAARDILKPGVSALELGRAAIAANDGVKPWIEHFYLAHGIGTDSAEMPLIGTDLGEAFDESMIMAPGMVLVFEPVIWDEGAAGYRSEDIVAVTDTGWVQLSGPRYDPFEVATPSRREMTGTMALEDGARVDFTTAAPGTAPARVRAVERAGLDALVLGRPGNVRYATGARQLWRTGAHPFAPLCVVIPETGRIHLLSTWDDGIPPEIGHDDLYGMFWNPAHLIAALAAIPGLSRGPSGRDRLPHARSSPRSWPTSSPTSSWSTPRGSWAPCGPKRRPTSWRASRWHSRWPKRGWPPSKRPSSPESPSATCSASMPRPWLPWAHPPRRARAWSSPPRARVRCTTAIWPVTRIIARGELVVLSPGALYAAYEGGVARTRTAGATPSRDAVALADRCHRATDALVAACRAGNTGADLYRAWESTGERPAEIALAYGMGIGTEMPMIGFGRSAGVTLSEGAVLSVQAWVSEEGVGGIFEREMLRIGDNGPEVIDPEPEVAR